MAVNTNYALAMASGIASNAPTTTADPMTGDMTPLVAPWVDLGAISVAGITENLAESRTEFKRWGNITTFKTVVTDQKHTFDVSFLESNANVLSTFYKVPGGVTPTGTATNEVQTLTITGAPTGGSFSLTFNGATTPALAYNAAPAAVQTALQALSTIGAGNATVTGTAGVSYVVTFAGTLANQNVGSLVPVGTFTGGTSPAITVATTTGGATGSLLSLTDDTTGALDVRSWVFDMLAGTNHIRFYVPRGEITARKNPVYKTDTLIEYGVTITAYPTSSGVSVKRAFLLDAVVLGL
jgi:hypothetical protein